MRLTPRFALTAAFVSAAATASARGQPTAQDFPGMWPVGAGFNSANLTVADTSGGVSSFSAVAGLTGTEAPAIRPLPTNRAHGIRQMATLNEVSAIPNNLQLTSVEPLPATWPALNAAGATPASQMTSSGPGAFGPTPVLLSKPTNPNGGLPPVWFSDRILSASTTIGSGGSAPISFGPTPAPEPTTILGLAAAGMGLAGYLRARSRRVEPVV